MMTMRTSIPKTKLKILQKAIMPLKHAFDVLSDHVIITDADANILYANEAVEKKTGFVREEVIGRNPADLWGGKMSQEFYEKMWHTIKIEKRPFVGEVRNVRKDGKEYWQESHVYPILDAHGEIRFYIGIEPDITDRKRKEQFRDEFISMIGHQLKNPIVAIRWMLELLSHGKGLSTREKEEVEVLYAETGGLKDLVSDLLVLARLENVALKKERIDVAHEVDEVIQAILRQKPKLSFSFKKEGKTFPLEASRTLVFQVFTNVISNAADYVDAARGKIALSIHKEGDVYIFMCRDNGIGISLEDQPKIFSRFFRGTNAMKEKRTGTGLGLYIAKMICDDLGWKISFESRVGNGTTFTVVIPVSV